jgi:hypothetical protein
VSAFLGGGGFDNLDLTALLQNLIPVLRRFRSSVVRDVQFELRPTPGIEAGAPVFDDVAFFTPADHVFEGMPLGFNFAVQVPPLPKFRNLFMDGVVVLGGADVSGRGLVPLGLGAGVNTQVVDDQVDRQGDLPAPGLVLTRMSPAHHGLEGSPYLLATVAVSLQWVNDASTGVALSGVFERVPENRLRFDPGGTQPVPPSTPFLSLPEGAKYNFLDAPPGSLTGRTFQIVDGPDLSAASIVRIQFADHWGRRWQVITDPATAAAGFVLPKPPSGSVFSDRTFHTGFSSGERSGLTVQALRLQREAARISFKELVEFNGTDADRLGEWMVAVSAVDYGRPEISWDTPVPANKTLAAGSAIKLTVRGIHIGNGPSDSVVKIGFTPPSSGCTEITINQDPSGTRGQLSATLPATCTGDGVVMAAQLYDHQGKSPLAPLVRSDFQPVNIH